MIITIIFIGLLIDTTIWVAIFSKNLTKPLLQLLKVTNKISTGDLSKSTLAINTSDELGRLSIGLCEMENASTSKSILTSVETMTKLASSTSDNAEKLIEVVKKLKGVSEKFKL